ncbi:ash family protein [Escherichia coli]|nr:ash family protein [Escherichia coli]
MMTGYANPVRLTTSLIGVSGGDYSNIKTGTIIMTNLSHDYYVNLVKILLKKASYADKVRLAEIIEREAMRIASNDNAVSDAKISLVTKVVMGGAK